MCCCWLWFATTATWRSRKKERQICVSSARGGGIYAVWRLVWSLWLACEGGGGGLEVHCNCFQLHAFPAYLVSHLTSGRPACRPVSYVAGRGGGSVDWPSYWRPPSPDFEVTDRPCCVITMTSCVRQRRASWFWKLSGAGNDNFPPGEIMGAQNFNLLCTKFSQDGVSQPRCCSFGRRFFFDSAHFCPFPPLCGTVLLPCHGDATLCICIQRILWLKLVKNNVIRTLDPLKVVTAAIGGDRPCR